jgi:hypothetical protein
LEEKVAKKIEKKPMSFTDVKINIFTMIGLLLGLALGYLYFGWLFGEYVMTTRKYIDQDWVKVQYYSNRVVDQVIKLKKMMSADKVKYNSEVLDAAIDTRSRIIGSDSLEDKTKYLNRLEPQINDVIAYYNGRLDLKNKRFGYVEWGMLMTPYLEEYNLHKELYAEAVVMYNDLISKFPFKGAAKGKKLTTLPLPEESKITAVKTNREEYETGDDIYRMDKYEGSSSAGSY